MLQLSWLMAQFDVFICVSCHSVHTYSIEVLVHIHLVTMAAKCWGKMTNGENSTSGGSHCQMFQTFLPNGWSSSMKTIVLLEVVGNCIHWNDRINYRR